MCEMQGTMYGLYVELNERKHQHAACKTVFTKNKMFTFPSINFIYPKKNAEEEDETMKMKTQRVEKNRSACSPIIYVSTYCVCAVFFLSFVLPCFCSFWSNATKWFDHMSSSLFALCSVCNAIRVSIHTAARSMDRPKWRKTISLLLLFGSDSERGKIWLLSSPLSKW